jgi:5-methylcytosine-specific restriction endonuclease McrA
MAPNPKPTPHRIVKARRQRSEAKANRLVYRAVHARDEQFCRVCRIYCGASIHLHHIVYRSLGGPTTLENLLSVCQKCHAAIHAKRIEVSA